MATAELINRRKPSRPDVSFIPWRALRTRGRLGLTHVPGRFWRGRGRRPVPPRHGPAPRARWKARRGHAGARRGDAPLARVARRVAPEGVARARPRRRDRRGLVRSAGRRGRRVGRTVRHSGAAGGRLLRHRVSARARRCLREREPRAARPPRPGAGAFVLSVDADPVPRDRTLDRGAERRRPGPRLRTAALGRRDLVARAQVASPSRRRADPADRRNAPACRPPTGWLRRDLLRGTTVPRRRRPTDCGDDTPRAAVGRRRPGPRSEL